MSPVRGWTDRIESFLAPEEHPGASPPTAYLVLSDAGKLAVDIRDDRYPLWQVLVSERQSSGGPVYVETDESGARLERLFIPRPRRILEMAENPRERAFRLRVASSPRPFFLRADHPRFQTLLARLSAALSSRRAVLMTTDPNTGEVLDVGEEAPASRPFELRRSARVLAAGPLRQELNQDEAEKEFDFLAGQRIPFDHPAECCCARAGRMGEFLNDHRIVHRKQWSFGTLFAPIEAMTLFGMASWYFHVAPTVLVRIAATNTVEPWVIDPSMFRRPATLTEWHQKQKNVIETAETGSARYCSDQMGGFINDFSSLEADLAACATERDLAHAERLHRPL